MLNLNITTLPWDQRRDILIPGNASETIAFCVKHFLLAYHEAIKDHGAFYVALSGGSTPKSIFQALTTAPLCNQIDWSKIHLFWSDERSVGPQDPDSNFHMAMESGFKKMPIPAGNIHRMQAEEEIEKNAIAYQQKISSIVKNNSLDYIMLGMGEDGHTASLFPGTSALHEEKQLVVANWVPQKNTWRMTFTYPLIHLAKQVVIYVIGDNKKEMLLSVWNDHTHPHTYPVSFIGNSTHKATWICDSLAASKIPTSQ
ncbi:MAG: 6-phosphogluconolactonase [Chlamydiae bacterium]|nr:6-phosphogluconolactonase [Chlamydiota bacterium]